MSLRNAEVIQAMGMVGGLLQRWGRDRANMIERQVSASERAATMQSIIKFLRMAMQSVILGIGAYLVINRMTTAGAMFAASLLARACAAAGRTDRRAMARPRLRTLGILPGSRPPPCQPAE